MIILPEVAECCMVLYMHLTCVTSVPQSSLAQWALWPPCCDECNECVEVRASQSSRESSSVVGCKSVGLVLSIVPCGGKCC